LLCLLTRPGATHKDQPAYMYQTGVFPLARDGTNGASLPAAHRRVPDHPVCASVVELALSGL